MRRDPLELVRQDGVRTLGLARLDHEREPAARGHSDPASIVVPSALIAIVVSPIHDPPR